MNPKCCFISFTSPHHGEYMRMFSTLFGTLDHLGRLLQASAEKRHLVLTESINTLVDVCLWIKGINNKQQHAALFPGTYYGAINWMWHNCTARSCSISLFAQSADSGDTNSPDPRLKHITGAYGGWRVTIITVHYTHTHTNRPRTHTHSQLESLLYVAVCLGANGIDLCHVLINLPPLLEEVKCNAHTGRGSRDSKKGLINACICKAKQWSLRRRCLSSFGPNQDKVALFYISQSFLPLRYHEPQSIFFCKKKARHQTVLWGSKQDSDSPPCLALSVC